MKKISFWFSSKVDDRTTGLKGEKYMEQKRESWGSRFGFIMATAGFAIGLGNIWRFPYMVGTNGGGAFLVVYLAICFTICVPLFIAEISLGRKTRLNPIQGMQKLTHKGSPWVMIGWIGAIACILLMSYYLMVIGWMAAYFVKALTGVFAGVTPEQTSVMYDTFVSDPMQVGAYTLGVVVVLGVIVTRGLKDGVEKACKWMLPALMIMLLILAVKSLMMSPQVEGAAGAMAGLKWYVTPDFSKINGGVVLAALGQAFFSIGIGIACAFVYGSYLAPDSDLPADATIVIALDTGIAVVAGLVIFPALFCFGMDPQAGPGLLFKTMPVIFGQLPGGSIFASMFFFLVVLAGLTSGMGYLEAPAATFSELFGISRKKSVWGILAIMYILGIPSILSQGPWSHILIFGKNFFDLADYISGNVMMPVDALLIALYTAFVWKFANFKDESNVGAKTFRIANSWKPLVVAVVPVAVFIIMVTAIF